MNIMFYEQGISQLLLSNSFIDLAVLMNISIDDNLLCHIHGLTAKQKILCDIIAPALIIVSIAILYHMFDLIQFFLCVMYND